ncbi:CBO0543 family protein [Bacillus sp. CGMCC 1.16607]|uniref:CBO0543 family protein n=1 Tax=Bacillus sp. CGMCC 1.16607 TaxID=3351842 RepID=UPI0036305DA5
MAPLISEEEINRSDEFFEQIHKIEKEYFHYWIENTLWDWEFWLSIFLSVFPWIVWLIVRKRGSEARLLLAGSFALIIASWLDFLGIIFGLWHYSGRVLPTIPAFLPWDFSLIPVTLMLWLQFKPTYNPFLKAIIYSALSSFIGEPLFEWIGFYTEVNWSAFYSFPIYTVIYLIAYRISQAKTFDTL